MARIEYNYPLLSHNTFGIEAYADRFVAYDSVEDLPPAGGLSRRAGVAYRRREQPFVPVRFQGRGVAFRHRWNRV